MNVTLRDIKPGSTVMLRPGFGMNPPRCVVLTGVYADIKNGRPGVEYDGSWAYLDQIVKVISY